MSESVTQPDEVAEVIRARFAELLEVSPSEIRMADPLVELPGVDSLRFLQAIAGIENRLGIRLAEDDLMELRTVADLCALSRRRLG